ncbi:unnamed protein product [Lactuca virosa]|uniref:Uncharacterized protein n=1 Tax=Lactuca virosa TaxID=75947 RepID=A0AAU9PL15_9ASTR|nr:unnamed protein product [Lactuca virosa]
MMMMSSSMASSFGIIRCQEDDDVASLSNDKDDVGFPHWRLPFAAATLRLLHFPDLFTILQ